MNIGCIIIINFILVAGIFLCSYLRKKLRKHLRIQNVDILMAGFVFASFLFLSGKITDFEVAGVVKAKTEHALQTIDIKTRESINEIKDQQEIAMLWIQVLDAENMKDAEAAINYLKQILSKQESWIAFDNLGSAYKFLAEQSKAEEYKNDHLLKAQTAFIKSSELNDNISAVNVADIYAYFNNEEKCKEWLHKAQNSNRLPTYDKSFEIKYIDKYRHLAWFKELEWKEYK